VLREAPDAVCKEWGKYIICGDKTILLVTSDPIFVMDVTIKKEKTHRFEQETWKKKRKSITGYQNLSERSGVWFP